MSKKDPLQIVKKDPLQPQQCAERLSALAAPERLRIIRLLREKPRNVSEISEALQIPLLNLSHHLSVLKQHGFLLRQKQGRFVIYPSPQMCWIQRLNRPKGMY